MSRSKAKSSLRGSSSGRNDFQPSPEPNASATTRESMTDRFPQVPTARQSFRPTAMATQRWASSSARPRFTHSRMMPRFWGVHGESLKSESALEWLPSAFWSSQEALRSNGHPFSKVTTGMSPQTISRSTPSAFTCFPSSVSRPGPPLGDEARAFLRGGRERLMLLGGARGCGRLPLVPLSLPLAPPCPSPLPLAAAASSGSSPSPAFSRLLDTTMG
mmetsp:Transcript_50744/g.134080  ORF Transcript_50744/g.134080 Transcript_50744/m.134080 type:complete len:217 (-) Transcript_50744:253-903(-)